MTVSAQQLGGLQILLLDALGQASDTGLGDLGSFLAGTDGAVALVLVMLGLGVSGDNTLEVTQDNLARSLRNDVGGHDGSLAAAAGSVDNEGGDAVTGGMATQSFHDLDTLGNGGTEVAQTQRGIALIDVVGTDTDANQLVDQLQHDVDAVVNAGQQDGLVAQGDTSISQHGGSASSFLGDLLGAVEVSIQPDGMILLEDVAQLRSDTLRHNDGGTGTQTDDLDMGDGADAGDDVLQHLVGDQQGVTAGQQDVADLGMIADVLDAVVDLLLGHFGITGTGEAATGAMTAVHRALVSDQEQNAVGITMSQTGAGGVGILVQGVSFLVLGELQLSASGDLHRFRRSRQKNGYGLIARGCGQGISRRAIGL